MKKTLLMLAVCNVLHLSAQTWTAFTPPFPDTIGISDIEVVSSNVIWAVGYRYGVDDSLYYYGYGTETYYAVTADGGATWKTGTIPMGTNPFIANLAATDAGTAIVIGLSEFSNAKTLKTTDGGTTWITTPNNWDPSASWPDYIEAFSPAKYCVIGDPRNGEFEIYTTFNAGSVWQAVPPDNIPDPIAGEFGYNNCGFSIGNTIWFGTNQGRVYRSKNSGGSWEVFGTPLGTKFGNISFSDENNGIASTSYGFSTGPEFYRTADGGETWTKMENLPHNGNFLIFNTGACVPNTSYIVQGLAQGLHSNLTGPYETWISPDRGDTWQQVSSGEIIGWPTFINSTTGWAGDFQQLSRPTRLYKYAGSPLVGIFNPEGLKADVGISPNPAVDDVLVSLHAEEAATYWCLLNDAKGNLLRKIEIEKTTDFSQKIDLKDLPAGMYTLTVSSEKGSVNKKLLIVPK